MTEQQENGWTVGQLIDHLRKCDPSALVVMSKDAAGNGYSPLRTVDASYYLPETKYSGVVADEAKDLSDPSEFNTNTPCIALWPVH